HNRMRNVELAGRRALPTPRPDERSILVESQHARRGLPVARGDEDVARWTDAHIGRLVQEPGLCSFVPLPRLPFHTEHELNLAPGIHFRDGVPGDVVRPDI